MSSPNYKRRLYDHTREASEKTQKWDKESFIQNSLFRSKDFSQPQRIPGIF